MTPSILQTQFLKRYITMEPRGIPFAGPFAGVSTLRGWFNVVDPDIPTLQITDMGIKAFWSGVKKHGAKAVMGKPATVLPPNNTPPTGGTPAAVAA